MCLSSLPYHFLCSPMSCRESNIVAIFLVCCFVRWQTSVPIRQLLEKGCWLGPVEISGICACFCCKPCGNLINVKNNAVVGLAPAFLFYSSRKVTTLELTEEIFLNSTIFCRLTKLKQEELFQRFIQLFPTFSFP